MKNKAFLFYMLKMIPCLRTVRQIFPNSCSLSFRKWPTSSEWTTSQNTQISARSLWMLALHVGNCEVWIKRLTDCHSCRENNHQKRNTVQIIDYSTSKAQRGKNVVMTLITRWRLPWDFLSYSGQWNETVVTLCRWTTFDEIYFLTQPFMVLSKILNQVITFSLTLQTFRLKLTNRRRDHKKPQSDTLFILLKKYICSIKKKKEPQLDHELKSPHLKTPCPRLSLPVINC